MFYNLTVINESAISFCTQARTWLACGAIRLDYLWSRLREVLMTTGKATDMTVGSWYNAFESLLSREFVTPYNDYNTLGAIKATDFIQYRQRDIMMVARAILDNNIHYVLSVIDKIGFGRNLAYWQSALTEREKCLSFFNKSSSYIPMIPPSTSAILNLQEYVLDLQNCTLLKRYRL